MALRSPAAIARAETWIFDLDNTLYPRRCDLFDQVERRIRDYVSEHLGLDAAATRALRDRYREEYASTLRGLMIEHAVAPEPFLRYVHDIDYTPVIESPKLDRLLAALPGRKLIYTNGSVAHAERVLERLAIGHHFVAIFDIAAADYQPKPFPGPYARLLAREAIAPAAAVMVEDIARNLEPAAELGMTTVWLRPTPAAASDPFVHHAVDDLEHWLAGVVGEAWARR
jgi:putative hydrolase of the HAD superfamily